MSVALDVAPLGVNLYIQGGPEECSICYEEGDVYRHMAEHHAFCTACKTQVLAMARLGELPKCPICRVDIGSIDGVAIEPLRDRVIVEQPTDCGCVKTLCLGILAAGAMLAALGFSADVEGLGFAGIIVAFMGVCGLCVIIHKERAQNIEHP